MDRRYAVGQGKTRSAQQAVEVQVELEHVDVWFTKDAQKGLLRVPCNDRLYCISRPPASHRDARDLVRGGRRADVRIETGRRRCQQIDGDEATVWVGCLKASDLRRDS